MQSHLELISCLFMFVRTSSDPEVVYSQTRALKYTLTHLYTYTQAKDNHNNNDNSITYIYFIQIRAARLFRRGLSFCFAPELLLLLVVYYSRCMLSLVVDAR